MGSTILDRDNVATTTCAKFGRDDLAGDFDGQIWPDKKVRFAQDVRRAYGPKATMAIVQYCGCPERTARNYASAHSEPPWSVGGDLLLGKEGDKFLREHFRGRTPEWFLEMETALAIKRAIEGIGNGSGRPTEISAMDSRAK
jgi:hypothetical protein